MKRMVSLVLVLLLTLLNLSAFATVEQITSVAQEPGYENILFRNGYRGFCVDEGLDGALVGDVFEMIPASYTAANDGGGRIIDQYLKTLIVGCFDDLFAVQADGTYAMTTDGQWLAQRVIWHYTDGYTRTDESQQAIQQMVEKVDELVAAGEEIPDHGHVKQLNDKTQLRFDFVLLQTRVDGQQCFFGYMVTPVALQEPPVEEIETPTEPMDGTLEDDIPTDKENQQQDSLDVVPETENQQDLPSSKPNTDFADKNQEGISSSESQNQADVEEFPATGDAFSWWWVLLMGCSVLGLTLGKRKKDVQG